MNRNISINLKIIGIFTISWVLLLLLMSFVYYRNLSQYKNQISNSVRQGNTLVLESILKGQKESIDKIMNTMLSIDELVQFLVDRKDANAKMIIDGMFISLEIDHIRRLSLYDMNLNAISQIATKGLSEKSAPIYPNPISAKRPSLAKLKSVISDQIVSPSKPRTEELFPGSGCPKITHLKSKSKDRILSLAAVFSLFCAFWVWLESFSF